MGHDSLDVHRGLGSRPLYRLPRYRHLPILHISL